MELSYKREGKKYDVSLINIKDQDAIKMTELYVNMKLDDASQEVFYSQLEDKEINTENIKEALYQAVLSKMSVTILNLAIDEFKKAPDTFKEEIKKLVEEDNKK